MDRVLGVVLGILIVFGAGIGVDRIWLLLDANSNWAAAMQRATVANAAALQAERRLNEAQTKRQLEAKKLEESLNAADLSDCRPPADVLRMLDIAAESTRSGQGARRPAGPVP